MRNSNLLKWVPTSVNKNNKLAGSKDKEDKGSKKWIHNPETLKNGHVAYVVKFLGCTEVDKPKGIEVVKQGIQKLKFNQQLKKSEGSKTPKAELTISVEGVAIQEPKTKKILHQYPLHKISYCADDKAEKRFFSFISKDGDGKHTCFVFVSDKLAEEITLTIGQAFELAYKKYLDTSGKELETQKQLLTLQKRIELLENENAQLKTRLRDISKIKGEQDIQEYLTTNKLNDLCEVNVVIQDAGKSSTTESIIGKNESDRNENDVSEKSQISSEENDSNQLISFGVNSGLDEKLDGLSLDDLNDDDFNPRGSDDDDLEFNPRKSMTENSPSSPIQSFSTSPFPPSTQSNVPTTPFIEAPRNAPALPPRDTNKVTSPVAPAVTQPFNNNDKFHSDSGFGSNNIFNNNPFESPATKADPFGMSSFDNNPTPFSKAFSGDDWGMAQKSVTANTLSLDELDPLKK